ncbi:MAG: electron transport complex subunit RsxC [Oscillospiraceae bacterium]|nr:electron transport complex subunit RsxC [Oscillospiraceae bacterium]
MSKLHSVRLPHFSGSAEQLTRKIPTPEIVAISMLQHIGAPCEPCVAVGDNVKIGQKIGDTEAFMSAPVHASVSGVVKEIKDVMNVGGRLCKTVVIANDNKNEVSPDVKPPKIDSREEFIKAVRESGAVGLGGAGFPTHVKLAYDRSKVKIDYLLLNGAECEPYITSDYRELIENSDNVLAGIDLVMKKLEIPNAIIGIEADKPEAISKLDKLAIRYPNISVQRLPSAYPQGAEKVLVHTLTGRVVGEGKLPSDVGCMVMNVSTAGFIYNYVKTGMPLVKRRITVDGDIVNSPSNFFIPVGTLLHSVVGFADVRRQPDRIVLGGPMMGACAFDPDTPLGKTNNAVLLFGNTTAHKPSACIRCGRCVRACAVNLMPTELESAYDARDAAALERLKINLCMNCGACSFVCPAKRQLAEKNQLAKDFLRQSKAKQQGK